MTSTLPRITENQKASIYSLTRKFFPEIIVKSGVDYAATIVNEALTGKWVHIYELTQVDASDLINAMISGTARIKLQEAQKRDHDKRLQEQQAQRQAELERKERWELAYKQTYNLK